MKKKTYNCISAILFVISCIALAFFIYSTCKDLDSYHKLTTYFWPKFVIGVCICTLIAEVSLFLGIRSVIFDWKNNATAKRVLSISIILIALICIVCMIHCFLPWGGLSWFAISIICDIILLIEDLYLIYLEEQS